MYRSTILSCALVLLACAGVALADNTIVLWQEPGDPNIPPSAYTIVQIDKTITINDPGGYNFRFYAHDGSGTPGTGSIDSITLDDPNTATGDFTLLIADPNDPNEPNKPGALNWKAGNLVYPGGTSTVLGIHLAGNLCADASAEAGDIVCEEITGDIAAQTLVGNLSSHTLQNLTVTGNGPHAGNIILWPNSIFQKRIEIGDPADPQGVMNGNIYLGTRFYTCNGYVAINGDMNGTIQIDDECRGRIHIKGDLGNDITIGYLGVEDPGTYCDRPWIEVDGDVLDPSDPNDPNTINRIYVGTLERDSWEGGVHVHGDMGGQIVFNGDMNGTRIYIDGLFKANVDAEVGAEIDVAAIYRREESSQYVWGAVVVNADGFDPAEPDGNWADGAVVKVGNVSYTGGDSSAHVLDIVPTCAGDVNFDGSITSDDWTAYVYVPFEYDWRFPGLAPSRVYHSDGNGDGSWDPYGGGGQWQPDQSDDAPYIAAVVTVPCCLAQIPDHMCLGDIVLNAKVDLADLSALLAGYGMTSGATYDDGDLDDDEDVDLADLAALLSVYDTTCECPEEGLSGGEMFDLGNDPVTVTVEPIDTEGYEGGGFYGEVDHFVFDIQIEIGDPNNDDWTATGAELDTYNDATFRLSSGVTTGDAYGTFVGAPWTSVPAGSSGAIVAGAYSPPDPNEIFETDDLNIAWYDTSESNDGPATVMRIVIDVSEVDGADVSEGFGSVYFSNSGPASQDDILVADLTSGTATSDGGGALYPRNGSFYVTGE